MTNEQQSILADRRLTTAQKVAKIVAIQAAEDSAALAEAKRLADAAIARASLAEAKLAETSAAPDRIGGFAVSITEFGRLRFGGRSAKYGSTPQYGLQVYSNHLDFFRECAEDIRAFMEKNADRIAWIGPTGKGHVDASGQVMFGKSGQVASGWKWLNGKPAQVAPVAPVAPVVG